MTNRTIHPGDRVYVRNQAGSFLSNDYGQYMTWVVANVNPTGMTGCIELHGKMHRWQFGNRWFAATADCELAS